MLYRHTDHAITEMFNPCLYFHYKMYHIFLGEFDIKDFSQGDFVLLFDSVTVISIDICLHGRWLKIKEAKFSAGHLPPVFR